MKLGQKITLQFGKFKASYDIVCIIGSKETGVEYEMTRRNTPKTKADSKRFPTIIYLSTKK